jgi:hypothetical protein
MDDEGHNFSYTLQKQSYIFNIFDQRRHCRLGCESIEL